MSSSAEEVVVSVRDYGNGCTMTPTTNDPPGLGLAMMSELSEGLSIASIKERGTIVGATIRSSNLAAELPARQPASHGSRFDFADPAFLMPVVPRAVAVHAAGAGASVDLVRSAISGGRDIVHCIEPGAISSNGGTLVLDNPDGADRLDVTMGPMPESAAEPLLGRLRGALDPSHRSSIEAKSDSGVSVLVSMAML